MPHRPPSPCAQRGCRELCHGRYCPEHKRKEQYRYNHFERDPGTNQRYGRAWDIIRAAFLQAHPLCEQCQREGRLTAAVLAHHKIKITDGGTNDWANLMALCSPCHSRTHIRQGDYF